MRETIFDEALGLYIESISGDLSPEDQAMLERKLVDPAFKKVWQTLHEQGKEISINAFVQNLDTQENLNALNLQMDTVNNTETDPLTSRSLYRSNREGAYGENSFEHKNVIKNSSKWKRVAAAIVLLFLMGAAGYLITKNGDPITNNHEIAVKVHQALSNVELHLGNGKSVSLPKDNTAKVIKVGTSTLNVEKGSLQFASSDPSFNTLTVPDGQSYKIVLADGTIVQLNAASKLRFPFRFEGDKREVFIEGEAYFEVAKDARHPFIVHTALTDIKVLGTHFNVNTYSSSHVVTSLVEGKVETVDSTGRQMKLLPGQEANYSTKTGFIKSPFDKDNVLSWINGVFYFHDEPIINLVNVISRCYGVSVILENPHKYGHTSITGLMNKNNLPELLNDLQTTAGIRYFYAGNRLHLQ